MGGFSISPMTTGPERGRIEEVILESLIEADGTALTKDITSVVYAEHVAESRAIAYLWHLAARFRNQADPRRTTDFLPRWERIHGIRPVTGDTTNGRRAKLTAKVQRDGLAPTTAVLTDLLTTVLGDVFVDVVHTSSSDAVGQVPGGATITGGATLADGPWYSTVAHVVIETTQPSSMTEPVYYETVAQLGDFLDNLLPAWVTWDWVLDGVNGTGFYLDEDRNLDNQRFD